MVVALLAAPLIISCKPSRASSPPGDEPEEIERSTSPGVTLDAVPDGLRDKWKALVAAREDDRSAPAVTEAADALLADEPPALLRAGALEAKAEGAYLRGEDADAIALADEALGLLDGLESAGEEVPEALQVAIHRALGLALVRSGDPFRAVEVLDRLDGWKGLERELSRGARAVALDRKGDREGALVAFVGWRELLADDSPDAAYAEARVSALARGLERARIEALVERAPGPDAADCLRAALGVDPGDQAPAWVARCRPLPTRIGILLPRSGKLAALADQQFAAASAAVAVLGKERPVSVLWRDSGSSTTTTKAAADAIIADGAEVIIGPVGVGNVRAAVQVGGQARFLIPGEGLASARGVAASLEQRALALVGEVAKTHARAAVFVPDNGYGKRVRKALESSAMQASVTLSFVSYSPGEKSFGKLMGGVSGELEKGSALVIADALPRTELIVRQMRRAGMRVAGGRVDSEGPEVLVASMGEGLSPDAVSTKHDSLDGVILAPAAAPDASSRAFEDQYLAQQGELPDDQALLVWRALSAAWSGASGTLEPEAELVRVQGGRVVALQAP
ncbi:hypothetical protein PPSIR1_12253 [Plesiocystis pacifica SIR-1]|uniref:Leucine-binding protein domain-containing protein n=1 Tax=Plesiocystis pacifica SIR-1 TaxID=391625 RepID=A6G5Y0_9BACT|nr:hypothetical protein PPSIR1_12253 [Plesiocystis pacifica SIR-1]